MKKSWKTTACGIAAIIGGALVQFFPEYPLVMKIGGALASIASGIGLLFARDNRVTSEQAGAIQTDVKTDWKPPVALLLAGALLGLTGCTALKENPQFAQRVQTAAKLAAYVGSTEYLRAHPETRLAFEKARDELKFIEEAQAVDLPVLLAIVNRLPVKELKSDRAQMLVTAGTLLLSDYAGALPVERLNELQPLVKSIREGLDLALE